VVVLCAARVLVLYFVLPLCTVAQLYVCIAADIRNECEVVYNTSLVVKLGCSAGLASADDKALCSTRTVGLLV
jgi:hypothetical protein